MENKDFWCALRNGQTDPCCLKQCSLCKEAVISGTTTQAKKFMLEESKGEFIVKDSGERQEFESGMKRDTDKGKVRYDLVYMPMFKRWAEHMTKGADKYGAHNWQQANSEVELERFKSSAFRHFMQWWEGNIDEDHASAVFFNISGAEYVKEHLRKVEEIPF